MRTTTAVLDLYPGMNTHPLPKDAVPVAFVVTNGPSHQVVVQYQVDGAGIPTFADEATYFFVGYVPDAAEDGMKFLGAGFCALLGSTYFCHWGR